MNTRNIMHIAILISLFLSQVAGNEFLVDRSHSRVQFSVSHLVISKTRGHFNDFEGKFEVSRNGKINEIIGKVKVKSIDTDHTKRDAHLRSKDFFEAEAYPEMIFKSKRIFQESSRLVVSGILTIRDQSLPITLTGKISQTIVDPWGNTRIGLSLKGAIDRRDFGITWSKTMDKGGLVVGNEVELELDLEGIQDKTTKS